MKAQKLFDCVLIGIGAVNTSNMVFLMHLYIYKAGQL